MLFADARARKNHVEATLNHPFAATPSDQCMNAQSPPADAPATLLVVMPNFFKK